MSIVAGLRGCLLTPRPLSFAPFKHVAKRPQLAGLTARCPGCTIGTQSDEAGWLQYCESKERNPSAAAEGEVQARKGKGVVPP